MEVLQGRSDKTSGRMGRKYDEENREYNERESREEEETRLRNETKGSSQSLTSLININARGLVLIKDKSKIKQLEYLAKEQNCSIIIVTETWLDPSVECGEINIPGYSLYRGDRVGRKRGGVCIYVRADIPVAPAIQHSNGVVSLKQEAGQLFQTFTTDATAFAKQRKGSSVKYD